MKFANPRRVGPEFNLTPLIDILFIVLIFLVLTTTFRDVTTLRVTLPTASSSTVEPQTVPGLIDLTVAEDGSLELRGERIGLDELRGLLAAIADPEEAIVRLRADARVSHGVVVEVLDVVRRARITQISIETSVPVVP